MLELGIQPGPWCLAITGTLAITVHLASDRNAAYYTMLWLITPIAWTFQEYLMHRWFLHGRNTLARKSHTECHESHDSHPSKARRLFVPVAFTAMFGTGYYVLISYFMNSHMAAANLCGNFMCYCAFEWSQYVSNADHQNVITAGIRSHQLEHYSRKESVNYGFTCAAWDLLFGTYHECISPAKLILLLPVPILPLVLHGMLIAVNLATRFAAMVATLAVITAFSWIKLDFVLFVMMIEVGLAVILDGVISNPLKISDCICAPIIYVYFVVHAVASILELRSTAEQHWSSVTPSSQTVIYAYIARSVLHLPVELLIDQTKLTKLQMVAHHGVSSLGFYYGLATGRMHFFFTMQLLSEFSSIPLCILMMWKSLMLKENILYLLNGVCLWALFFFCRIVMYPVLFAVYAREVNAHSCTATIMCITVRCSDSTPMR